MKCIQTLESKDAHYTKKYIFSNGKNTCEFVYVEKSDKHIVCISCMYGCPIKCAFCRSGDNYFGKILGEDMIFMIKYIVADKKLAKSNKRILFSFMGSGEPMLNIDAILQCMNYFENFKNYSISISLSGVGIKNLKKITDHKGIKPKIQFSLHSTFDVDRIKLMPLTPKINEILPLLKKYQDLTQKKITINYILLDKFNDTKKHAAAAAKLIKEYDFDFKINDYHAVNQNFIESKHKKEFILWLENLDIKTELYATDGVDIGAACGQLSSNTLI